MQSDPIGLRGGLNTYAYAILNPLKWIDANGLEVKWTGSAAGGGAALGLGGLLLNYSFTSECKCNKKVTVEGFASFVVIGSKGKASSGGASVLYTPGDCPNASDFNGPAFTSGFSSVIIAGGQFLTRLILGSADSGPVYLSGPYWGIDVGLHYSLFGWSAVLESSIKETCCN